MISFLKKFIFANAINLTIFIILIVGIQNSSNKYKVDLLIAESIELPLGFIMGVSFISGSVLSSLIPTNNVFNKAHKAIN